MIKKLGVYAATFLTLSIMSGAHAVPILSVDFVVQAVANASPETKVATLSLDQLGNNTTFTLIPN